MPHANPETSFEAAARHLFRHVCDARELRRNPIARTFFKAQPRKGADDAAIAALHARIRDEARACCADDAAAGKEAHARRGIDIVASICSGEDAVQTTARLNVSRRQYYRERNNICTRIARALMPDRQRPAPAVTACDPLRLLFRRATALCDQGFAQKAVRLLDNAWSGIAAGDPRHEAQLELADALIALGDVARASKVLASVRRHSAECVSERAEWFADRELLTEARLAFATGRDAEVGPALSAMIERQGVAQRAGELAFDALVECGMWHCANARFDDARRLLRRARTVVAKTAELSPPQRISLALLEAYCVEDGADVFDGSYRRFRVALDASVAAGSMRGALEATTGLMGYYASVGSDGPMYDLAERALDIARATEGRRQMLVAAAWIGTTFMKTAQWRAVSRLLFEAEELSPKGALYWTFVKEAQGDFLARTGRYEAAQSCFAAAQDAARNLKNRKWEAIALRDAGTMLGRIGHAAESAESMRRAVEIAEGAAGAWSASLTYRAAAKVLADRRVERLANSMPATLVEPGRRATRDAAGRGARHGALVLSREPSTT